MSKKQLFLNISIGVAILAVLVVVLIKFVLPGKSGVRYEFRDFEKIVLHDLNGKEIMLSSLVSKDESTYCFLFNMSDCFSCIVKGIEDLESLKNSGKRAIGLMVHDSVEEVKGWSSNYKFSPFYAIKRAVVYEHIIVPKLPVMLEIRDNSIENIRYIQL
jgi:hypothetical protein